jgi:hypothetical protein
MTVASYPAHNSIELGKILPKLSNLPDFVEQKDLYMTASNDNGEIKTYGLYECPDDKVYEGFIGITKRLTSYFVVEGFKFKIEPLLTVREALPLLGLAPP